LNGDALRGHLELLLLATLAEGDGHGYAMIERLHTRTEGSLTLADGSIYPALHRLERAGFVKSKWEPGSSRRKRVYALTASGRKRLGQEKQAWNQLVRTVELIIDPS
jgi:transcriptional regulator